MALNQTLYKTGSDKYYKCSAEDTIKVNDWVSLKTKDLRFVAFHTDTKEPNLFGDNGKCPFNLNNSNYIFIF